MSKKKSEKKKAQERKVAVSQFFYPEYNLTIEAENKTEADTKLNLTKK